MCEHHGSKCEHQTMSVRSMCEHHGSKCEHQTMSVRSIANIRGASVNIRPCRLGACANIRGASVNIRPYYFHDPAWSGASIQGGDERSRNYSVDMSRVMRICLGENKGADQLRSNCEADHRPCFCYTDSTISLLLKLEFLSL